jgi:hypothetical protein
MTYSTDVSVPVTSASKRLYRLIVEEEGNSWSQVHIPGKGWVDGLTAFDAAHGRWGTAFIEELTAEEAAALAGELGIDLGGPSPQPP